MVKISLFQAKIIKKLEDLPLQYRSGSKLTTIFLKGRQYLYQNLRDLKDWNLLEEISRGRTKFYNPTAQGLEIASKRIEQEIAKRKQEERNNEIDSRNLC